MSIELFCLHIHHQNWDICHIVGSTFVTQCRRKLPPGIGTTVTLISVSLSFWKRRLDRTRISWGVRKDGNHWVRGPGIGWMIKHLPSELLQEMCWPLGRVWPGFIVQQDNTGTKHPAPFVLQKLYHRPHFTVGGSWNKSFHLQPLQRCYC